MLISVLQLSFILGLLGLSLAILILFLRGRLSPKMSLILAGFILLLGIGLQKGRNNSAFSFANTLTDVSKENTTDSAFTTIKESTHLDQPVSFSEPSTTAPQKSNSPEAIPESYEADFPPVHPFITLRLEGLSDPQFKESLGRYMGFKFVKKKGDFVLSVGFTGTTLESNNRALGRRQYNYSGGAVVISIDGVPCVGQGNYWLPETHYEGYETKQLIVDLEKRKAELLMKNIRQLARDLKNCLPI